MYYTIIKKNTFAPDQIEFLYNNHLMFVLCKFIYCGLYEESDQHYFISWLKKECSGSVAHNGQYALKADENNIIILDKHAEKEESSLSIIPKNDLLGLCHGWIDLTQEKSKPVEALFTIDEQENFYITLMGASRSETSPKNFIFLADDQSFLLPQSIFRIKQHIFEKHAQYYQYDKEIPNILLPDTLIPFFPDKPMALEEILGLFDCLLANIDYTKLQPKPDNYLTFDRPTDFDYHVVFEISGKTGAIETAYPWHPHLDTQLAQHYKNRHAL